MSKVDYPTTLDEIDQWLFDSFGILPGACSSTENLRYTTARMIAEVLWPKKGEKEMRKMIEAEIVADFFGPPCGFSPLDGEVMETCDCEHFCGTPEQTDAVCWQRYFDYKKKEERK